MNICMAGFAGDTGAVLLARDNPSLMKSRFSASFLKKACESRELCAIPDEEMTIKISDGGVYKALWRLGELLGSGLEAVSADIPIKQETIEICEVLDVNPYEIESDGYIFVIPDGELPRQGKIIGRTRNDNDRIILLKNVVRYLNK